MLKLNIINYALAIPMVEISLTVIRLLGISSIVRKVDTATSNTNTDYNNDGAGPSGVALFPQKALMSIDHHLTTPLRPILKDKARAVSKLSFLRHCTIHDFLSQR